MAAKDLRRGALARFHVVLKNCGISDDEKAAILESEGVKSAGELSVEVLLDIAQKLEGRKTKDSIASWRYSVKKVITEWLLAKKKAFKTADYAEKIACQAAKTDKFTDISVDTLQKVYYRFKRDLKNNLKSS